MEQAEATADSTMVGQQGSKPQGEGRRSYTSHEGWDPLARRRLWNKAYCPRCGGPVRIWCVAIGPYWNTMSWRQCMGCRQPVVGPNCRDLVACPRL